MIDLDVFPNAPRPPRIAELRSYWPDLRLARKELELTADDPIGGSLSVLPADALVLGSTTIEPDGRSELLEDLPLTETRLDGWLEHGTVYNVASYGGRGPDGLDKAARLAIALALATDGVIYVELASVWGLPTRGNYTPDEFIKMSSYKNKSL
jgi:hypothetical protein